MPTLDDLPTLASFTPSGDDLLPIYDLTGEGSSKVRKVSLNQINGISATDVTGPAVAPTNITTRLNVVSSGTTTALPLASGVMRDVIVMNQTALGLAVTAASIFTASIIGTQTTVTIPANTSGRFLSNGVAWYRTH